jgi:O-antigen/teichoic acid export membrane protein
MSKLLMIDKIKNNAFARNSIILFIGTMVANFLGYVFHLVIGRMVSVEVYGEIESLISLLAIISVPAAALSMVATKYGAGCKADGDKIRNYIFFKFLNKKVFFVVFPIFLAAVLLTPIFKKFLNIQDDLAIITIWLMMILSFFSAISNGILSGWQKFRESSWAGIWGMLIKLAVAVLFIKAGFALGGAMGGYFIGILASYLISLYFLRSVFQKSDEANIIPKSFNFQSVKNYVIPVFLGNLAITILGNVDMVLAKHSLDPQTAGQYGALTIVSKIIFFVTSIAATVLFSMSAENNHKKRSSLSILKMASAVTGIISLGSIIFYFSFPKFVLGMLFGGKYSDVAYLLGWFSVLVVTYSFANLLFQYFLSIHKTKIVYWYLTVSILEILAILFVGKSISAILVVVIISQVLALASGLIYLAKIHKTVGQNI